jgi:tetratricopeptide (TPR) repeat protein
MTDHTSVSIPPPKDWQAFERHARLLFQLSLNDAAVQNNGTSGQRQHGVDIFGRRGGGTGPLVGVQCKGKNADYGGKVTEKELRAEVEKTRKFVPPLDEFILITTAPSDAKIQAVARVLEAEVRAQGRALTIQVWGWDRVQQEIILYQEAIRVFHPDATPFTDQILNEQRETRRLVKEEGDANAAGFAGLAEQIATLAARLPAIAGENSTAADALDKELSSQIDGYRDLLRADKPRTALGLLIKLKERVGDSASSRIRYRILSNIGAAHYNLGEYDVAAGYLLEAAPLNPGDPVSLANKTAALLITGRKKEAHAQAIAAVAAHPDSQEIAQQRLQALGEDETVEDVWGLLSETAKRSPLAFSIRISALREAGDRRWMSVSAEAMAAFPDDAGLKIMNAEGVIELFQRAIRVPSGEIPRAVPHNRNWPPRPKHLRKPGGILLASRLPSRPSARTTQLWRGAFLARRGDPQICWMLPWPLASTQTRPGTIGSCSIGGTARQPKPFDWPTLWRTRRSAALSGQSSASIPIQSPPVTFFLSGQTLRGRLILSPRRWLSSRRSSMRVTSRKLNRKWTACSEHFQIIRKVLCPTFASRARGATGMLTPPSSAPGLW